MPSRNSLDSAEQSQVALKAGLLLLSVSLGALEFFIPRIPLFPWLKPGLANIVTIVWLIRFGTLDALLFSLLRIWIVGFYFGFSILTLALGLAGAVAATCAMGLAWQLLGRRGLLGLAGLGIVGACAHNAGQLAAVYALLAHNTVILYQLPLMAVASVAAGGLVGLMSGSLLDMPEGPRIALDPARTTAPARTAVKGVVCLLIFGWSVAIMFVEHPQSLLWHAVGATVLVQVVAAGSLRALFAPVRSFWLLLLMVAMLHLFFTYGQRIAGLPLVTVEGAREASRQLLRLWTWLQLSQVLKRSGFGDWMMAGLHRLLPHRRETLGAGLLALEYFPETLAWAQRTALPSLKRLIHSPRDAIGSLAADLYRELLTVLPSKE